MSKKKQIEEMAADICRVKHNCNDACNPINSCMALKYAHRAYMAGYRKQTEVAREIFEEIERILLLNKVCSDSGIYYEHDVEWDIAELKMKYTEEQT